MATAKKPGGSKRAPKKTPDGTAAAGSNAVPFREDPPRESKSKPVGDDVVADQPKQEPTAVANVPAAAAGPGHNSEAVRTARELAIKAAHEETYDLEKEEEALMKKYITPLRERRSEIKQGLKKDYEISAPQFNAWHGVYYFAREAESGQDWITLQVIKEQAKVLPVGGTMDLVEIAEKATKQREELAKAETAKKTKVENVEHSL